jgi:NADPH:quinone reductase-like Zn-dependent oxidoreductase
MYRIRSFMASVAAAMALVTTLPAAMAAPAKMQAIVQVAATGGDVLQLQTVDVPKPAATEILMKVYAAAVNPVDWKRRPVGMILASGSVMPAIPGYDAAGVVDAVGSAVTAWKVGDAVVARVTGAYAQYLVVDVATVVAKPRPFTFEQAAGMPIAGMAGFGAVDAANIQPGQRVAIIGAAGGAGSAALDAARAKGARIIASGHSSQAAWLKQRGVEEFVAYDKDNVAARIQGVDAVLNMVEGQADTALAYVKRGGYLTSIASGATAERCAAAGVTCVQIRATAPGRTLGETLRDMVALANAGKYTVHVTRTFALAEAAAAQQFARTGETTGKVILVVDAKSRER